MRTKSIVAAAMLVLAGTADALAADLPTPAPLPAAVYNWTGVYIGINGGDWTGKVEYLYVDLPNGACTTVANCQGAAGSIVSFSESIVRAGINFKFGSW